MWLSLEEHLGEKLPGDRILLAWLVRHAAWSMTKFQVKNDGRTAFAQDLPCFGGAQLAVDVHPARVLSTQGEAHPDAADSDGVVLQRARHVKETTYPQLVVSRRCKLVVLAIETGGTLERRSGADGQTAGRLEGMRSPVIQAFFQCH